MIDPGAQPVDEQRLAQEEMPAGPDRKLAAAGYGRSRRQQLGGIEKGPAAVALVTARGLVSAMWAGAEDVPVGQEAVVRRRPHLLDVPLLDQPCGIEASIEVLGQGMVLRRRRAAEVNEGQAKSELDDRRDCMLLLA